MRISDDFLYSEDFACVATAQKRYRLLVTRNGDREGKERGGLQNEQSVLFASKRDEGEAIFLCRFFGFVGKIVRILRGDRLGHLVMICEDSCSRIAEVFLCVFQGLDVFSFRDGFHFLTNGGDGVFIRTAATAEDEDAVC